MTGTGFLQRTGVDTWALAAAGTGDVVGPASATNAAFAVFDGTTGKLIKDSGITYGIIDSNNTLTMMGYY